MQITMSVKVGLTMYESLSLGTQKSVSFPYEPVSILSGLILDKMYGLFVGTNKTVHIKVAEHSFPVYRC